MKQEKIEQLAEKISIDRAAIDHERILADAEAALEASKRPETSHVRIPLRGRFRLLVCAGSLAAALLIISSWLACFVLHGEVTDLRDELELTKRDVATTPTDESTTINLYLREHQDVVARTASSGFSRPRPARMHVSQRDVLYYEFLDGEPGFTRPGIIVRGSSSQQEIGSSQTPAIANGHTLTLSEARETSNFDLVAPPRLYPGHRLDKIRRIDDRDALHLSYSNGIGRISLFEQHLDGQRQLVAQDFREYAVYLNKGQSGGAILAWRDDALSYVLVGNVEMSQLMDMAQSIGAGNEREQK